MAHLTHQNELLSKVLASNQQLLDAHRASQRDNQMLRDELSAERGVSKQLLQEIRQLRQEHQESKRPALQNEESPASKRP